MSVDKLIRGFLFACTQETEDKCLNNLLLASDKVYAPIVIRVRKGDLLFLNNLDTDVLYGVFRAVSDGFYNKEDKVFAGRYPYQVKVEALENIIAIQRASNILEKLDSNKRNRPLVGKKLVNLLNIFVKAPSSLYSNLNTQVKDSSNSLLEQINKIVASKAQIDIDNEIPLVETTTFWDFPRQSYGLTPKGNNKYAGVTPALIIYNMIWRYTEPGDLIVDPMCGSGTTIDVCKEEKRNAIGYDIVSTRPDVIQNDARNIPLENESVDMVFIDSPYGDNIKYNHHPNNIGNISSESEEFYDELEKVIKECHRILKDDKVLGWLIGDQWVKKIFTPVGFKIYERLCKYFEPVDLICVNRRGQSSNTDMWHNRARRFNFYLRGFKYLIIVRKTSQKSKPTLFRKIEWARYKR
jgi:DNA modification methylase